MEKEKKYRLMSCPYCGSQNIYIDVGVWTAKCIEDARERQPETELIECQCSGDDCGLSFWIGRRG